MVVRVHTIAANDNKVSSFLGVMKRINQVQINLKIAKNTSDTR